MAYRESLGLSVSGLKARLRENPAGAFAFYGPEEMLKQFYLEKFIALIEKEGAAEFNLVKLDFARNKTMSDVWDESQILPFGGERRLVICRGVNPAKLSASDEKKLMEILSDFPPYLILIFYLENEEFSSDNKNLQSKKVKKLAESLTFCNFPLQEERVLLTWSRKILEKDGLEATDKALRTLFSLCQNKMILIRGELEKLSAFALSQGKKEVTEEDVALFTEDTAEFAIYHLCDAILEGESGALEKIFTNLKRQSVEPVAISGAVSRTLTNALLIAEGAGDGAVFQITKIASWQADRYRRMLYGKKKEDLELALLLCLSLDGKLKGEKSDAFLVLEVALLEIARTVRGTG